MKDDRLWDLFVVFCRKYYWEASDQSIPFRDLIRLLKAMGFEERVRGSHHIFTKAGVSEILNLQSKAAEAKAYQVKQIRELISRYYLGVNAEAMQTNEETIDDNQ